MRRNAGFTLMEVLVVLGVMVLLLTLVLVNFNGINRRSEVANTAEDLSSLLREAQSQSMAVVNELPHGVFLDTSLDRFILFEGQTYDPFSPTNAITLLPRSIDIASVDLNGGGSSVIFEPLTGATSNFGSLSLQSTRDATIQAQVTISSQGKIHTE